MQTDQPKIIRVTISTSHPWQLRISNHSNHLNTAHSYMLKLSRIPSQGAQMSDESVTVRLHPKLHNCVLYLWILLVLSYLGRLCIWPEWIFLTQRSIRVIQGTCTIWKAAVNDTQNEFNYIITNQHFTGKFQSLEWSVFMEQYLNSTTTHKIGYYCYNTEHIVSHHTGHVYCDIIQDTSHILKASICPVQVIKVVFVGQLDTLKTKVKQLLYTLYIVEND